MTEEEQRYTLLRDEDGDSTPERPMIGVERSIYKLVSIILGFLLLLSTMLNIYFINWSTNSSHSNFVGKPSEYAGLVEEVWLPWEDKTEYNNENFTAMDRKWGELRADNGIITLPKTYAAEHGLQRGSEFPWDSSKDIYLLNGYHGIHCLSQLYLTLKEYRDDLPQSHTFEHSTHCLDWLRNDVMCRADDTPLYTTNSRIPANGIGQVRKCKDWSKLESWAKEHTACYRYGNFVAEDKLDSQIGRFKYCPADSPYLPKVREYFGKGDDWFPADEEIYIPF